MGLKLAPVAVLRRVLANEPRKNLPRGFGRVDDGEPAVAFDHSLAQTVYALWLDLGPDVLEQKKQRRVVVNRLLVIRLGHLIVRHWIRQNHTHG